VDRLSSLDAEFLHLEDGIAHMHIAGVCIFDDPPPTVDELGSLIASKLHVLPRYRQRVRRVPFELGRPVWVDDPHFAIGYHVRHTALPQPGDDAALSRLMGRVMSQPLDRDRPLWETWLVEGLDGDRWAVILKVHHCMVDGVAGVGLLAALLDAEPRSQVNEPEPWEPEPEPPAPALVLDAWGGLIGDSLDRIGQVPAIVGNPARSLRALSNTARGLAGFARRLSSTPPSSIRGSIGPHRSWASSSASLRDVDRIRDAFDGTINDVVLTAVSSGFRRLLASRGEDPAASVVRSMIPVSVRGESGRGVADNRVSTLLYELPVGIDDPVERLKVVHREMRALKGSHMAEAGEAVTSIGNLAPPMVVGMASRLAIRSEHLRPQSVVTTVTTNVPGPQFALYCLGREMIEYRPFVPISHGVRLGTAILSYNGRLFFGVTGDYDTAPDVGVVADAISEAIGELAELTNDPSRGRP
jgi:diacylglycerol O-acyltransferase